MLVPASVQAYIHDGGVRRAINELLNIPENQILEGLEWSELRQYYRAYKAARQLENDWALFAFDTWEQIWGEQLNDWMALSPDEQSNGDYWACLHPTALRATDDDSLWFGRVFIKNAYVLYASVSAIPSIGLKLLVSCESDSRSISFQEIAEEPDENSNWLSNAGLKLDTDNLELSSLIEVATKAVDLANQGSIARRSRKASRS